MDGDATAALLAGGAPAPRRRLFRRGAGARRPQRGGPYRATLALCAAGRATSAGDGIVVLSRAVGRPEDLMAGTPYAVHDPPVDVCALLGLGDCGRAIPVLELSPDGGDDAPPPAVCGAESPAAPPFAARATRVIRVPVAGAGTLGVAVEILLTAAGRVAAARVATACWLTPPPQA